MTISQRELDKIKATNERLTENTEVMVNREILIELVEYYEQAHAPKPTPKALPQPPRRQSTDD